MLTGLLRSSLGRTNCRSCAVADGTDDKCCRSTFLARVPAAYPVGPRLAILMSLDPVNSNVTRPSQRQPHRRLPHKMPQLRDIANISTTSGLNDFHCCWSGMCIVIADAADIVRQRVGEACPMCVWQTELIGGLSYPACDHQ